MLGVWIAPNGDMKTILKELKQSVVEWGENFRSGNSSKQEAWQVLHSNISSKLKYPLPVCTLTDKDCKLIMYPAIKAALPISGFTANMATGIRDVPMSNGGAVFLYLFNYQVNSLTAMIIEQVTRKHQQEYFL